NFVAEVVVVADRFAFYFGFRAAEAVVFFEARRRFFFDGGIRDEQDSPRAVFVDPVAGDDVVVIARQHHTAPHRPRSGDAGGGNVRVVVVVHRVFREQPAVVRPGWSRFACARARAVLRRGRVVVVLAVAHEPRLVVVEL